MYTYMNCFPGLIKLVPRPTFRNTAVTNHHPNITCYSSDLPRISWFITLKIIIGLASRWESSPQLLREKRSAARTHRSTFAHTVKNIRRFYGKITGNQLPVHFPLFLHAPVNIFRNQAQNGSKGHYCFLSYSPTILQRYFRVLSVNITLPYLDFYRCSTGKRP